MIRAYAAAAALTVLAPAAALAQATPEQAEAIRNDFKRWLNQQFQYYGPVVQIQVEGGIAVEPQGDAYGLTLGAITINMPPMTVSWDAIKARLEPLANGHLRTTFQMPPAIRIADTYDPAAATTVTIGSSEGDIVVAPEFKTMLSGTINLADLSATIAGGIGGFEIASIVLDSTAEERGDGIFDTGGGLVMDGFLLTGPGGVTMGLDQLAVEVTTSGVDLARYMALADQLNTLGRSMQVDPDVDSEAALAEMGRLWNEGGMPFDGFGIDYRLSGFSTDMPGVRVAFDGASLGFGLDGLTGDTASASAQLGISALDVAPAEAHELVPSAAEIELAVTGVPIQPIMDLVNGFFTGEPLDAFEPGGATMLDRFGEHISQAGLAFELRTLKVEAGGASVDASATLRPNLQAAFGAVGSLALAIGGLEQFVTELGEDADLGPILALLQSAGEEATDAEGQPIRRYELELTESGQALLNGNDVAPALQDALE